MKYCTNCGKEIEEGATFCTHCGAKTKSESHIHPPIHSTQRVESGWSFGKLFSGRLNRMNYFLGILFGLLPFFLMVSIWGIVNIIIGTFGTGQGTSNFGLDVVNTIIIPILFALSFIWFVAWTIILAFRRCHDFNVTGWLAMFGFIPYVNAVFGLILLFVPGTSGANKYGDSPAGRKFVASIFNL
jgi:uncharacterized membrane protein YhaH (DUF805 family)